MKLTTPVNLNPSPWKITHQMGIMALGSCFAERIGKRLANDAYNCEVNPLAELYNPLSVNEAIRRFLNYRLFRLEDLFEHKGLWHSWECGMELSRENPEEALLEMNLNYEMGNDFLDDADVLLLTWGTSRCYKYEGRVVANCHKVPARKFEEHDCSVAEIVGDTVATFTELFQAHPMLQVVLTVSPIRYEKYGFHASQLCKAALLLAAHEVQQQFPDNVTYFPAYEIMMDELRDYRFYADDMLHPSDKAVEYIFDRFSTCFLDPEDQKITSEWNKLVRKSMHVPFHPESAEYKKFVAQLEKEIVEFHKKYPYIDFDHAIYD